MLRFIYMLKAIDKAVASTRALKEKTNIMRQQAEINEAEIARRNNAVVIQDLQIDLLKLKIERERKEANNNEADSFRSEEY